jgi:hypothetical protein
MIERTNEMHVDYLNLLNAKSKLDKIVETINENKRKYEIANSMLRLTEFTSDLSSVSIFYFNHLSVQIRHEKLCHGRFSRS